MKLQNLVPRAGISAIERPTVTEPVTKAQIRKYFSVVVVLPGRSLKCSNFPGRRSETEKENGRKRKKGIKK